MIKGVGIDIAELKRIGSHIDDTAFIRRILTPEERDCFYTLGEKRKAEFLAGRFSAKEAYAKARGTGIGKAVSFQDLSVLNDPAGRPYASAPVFRREKIHLSITHTGQTVAAVCIIEGVDGPSAY